MLDGYAGRIYAQAVAAFQIVLRSNGATTKCASAVRTNIFQHVFHAPPAKGAFKSADHRVSGMGRQRRVAVLAGWSEFEHKRIQLIQSFWLNRTKRGSRG